MHVYICWTVVKCFIHAIILGAYHREVQLDVYDACIMSCSLQKYHYMKCSMDSFAGSPCKNSVNVIALLVFGTLIETPSSLENINAAIMFHTEVLLTREL